MPFMWTPGEAHVQMQNYTSVDTSLQHVLKQISENPNYCAYKQCTP